MIRRLFKKLLLALYLSVTVLVLLEIGVRFWGYSERHLTDPIYMPFASGQSEIPYVHRPNLSNARARGLARINTDSLGLRSLRAGERYDARRPGEYRIAIVGDSVTFGEGVVETEETFAQVLEDTLNRKQSATRVKVFNFAASAYNVQVMSATLRRRMPEVEPNLVLMAIIPEDFNLSRTPAVDARGYLTDNRLSGFLSRDSIFRLALRRIHTIYLLRDIIAARLERSARAEDILAAGSVPDSYSFVKEFSETSEQQRVAYAVVLLPSFKSRFGPLPSRLSLDGITFLDLSGLRAQFTSSQFQASRFDIHPSAAVHRRIAEALAAYILDGNLLAGQN
jgi:lysophospholipase L1-like esterase